MEHLEFILRENGTLCERTVRERDLQAEDEVLDTLTAGIVRRQKNVMAIPEWGMAHASVGPMDTLWSVPIQRLPLKARFRLVNGVLVPMFADLAELEMPLEWQVPAAVRLVFMVGTTAAEDLVTVTGNWLFGCNAQGQGYRLPLPNLHDDCLLCTGSFEDDHTTAQAAIVASLAQFERSPWNADLMRTVEQSQKFFRWRPTNDTFETLPIEATDWTTLCNKVSTAVLERVVLP